MRSNLTAGLIFFLALTVGFMLGKTLYEDNYLKEFSCNDIARFHQDYLIKHFGINDGFNTDTTNPRRYINQKALDLNVSLLTICLTDPSQ